MTLRIYVETENGPTEITEGVQVLYDHLVHSMDWGSGFLSVEDVEPILDLAETCGFKGVEDAQIYVVERRRESRRAELTRQGVEWGAAMDQACSEIGCSATSQITGIMGHTSVRHCHLPRGHEGEHTNGSVEWS